MQPGAVFRRREGHNRTDNKRGGLYFDHAGAIRLCRRRRLAENLMRSTYGAGVACTDGCAMGAAGVCDRSASATPAV